MFLIFGLFRFIRGAGIASSYIFVHSSIETDQQVFVRSVDSEGSIKHHLDLLVSFE